MEKGKTHLVDCCLGCGAGVAVTPTRASCRGLASSGTFCRVLSTCIFVCTRCVYAVCVVCICMVGCKQAAQIALNEINVQVTTCPQSSPASAATPAGAVSVRHTHSVDVL